MKKDKNGDMLFEIYWEQIWKSLEKNKHYKKLKDKHVIQNGIIDRSSINSCTDSEILKHYDLLQLDVLNLIYIPYMKKDFRWTNNEKRFVLERIKISNRDLLPSEIKQLLNENKQKQDLQR